jgi:hypothetical protein
MLIKKQPKNALWGAWKQFVSQRITQLENQANKKGLHFCNPLILLAKMAPPAGLEPATH